MGRVIEGVYTSVLLAIAGAFALGFAVLAARLLHALRRHQHIHHLASALARRRARRLSETLRLFRMAEQIAELGVWQYYPDEDRQEWSDGMKLLFGVDPGEILVDGDVETLLAANDVDLVELVTEDARSGEPSVLDFSILRLDGQQRELTLNALRLTAREGEEARIVAVLMDVTDQRRRERSLRKSREIALLEAQRAKEMAETDALTGIANRRHVMVQLDRLVMQSRRDGTPLSLIAFDVDHFKRVNDNYGHLAGDEVLRRIAAITREQVREGDIVGRIGGEEFVWVLPGANLDLAGVAADRLRLAIEAGSASKEVPPVTVSIGIASALRGDTGLSLFGRADEALYEAKNSGRNTVRMAA